MTHNKYKNIISKWMTDNENIPAHFSEVEPGIFGNGRLEEVNEGVVIFCTELYKDDDKVEDLIKFNHLPVDVSGFKSKIFDSLQSQRLLGRNTPIKGAIASARNHYLENHPSNNYPSTGCPSDRFYPRHAPTEDPVYLIDSKMVDGKIFALISYKIRYNKTDKPLSGLKYFMKTWKDVEVKVPAHYNKPEDVDKPIKIWFNAFKVIFGTVNEENA